MGCYLLRIVFFGTADFAVPSLQALVESGQQVLAVVTQPDKPQGRGHKLVYSPVKKAALECHLPVYQPLQVKDAGFGELLQNLHPHLIVVVAYGQILPQSILSLPPHGCINVHASLLPKYRGAAPVHWAIINGEIETGITTMYMAPALDSGDIILQKAVAIEPQMTVGLLHDFLAQEGAKLLLATVELIAQGKVSRHPQNASQASYAPLLTSEHEKIDWHKKDREIINLIRGLSPYPGASTTFRGRILKILEGRLMNGDTQAYPGTIINIDKNKGFSVQCGQGAVLVTKVKPEGKNVMDAASFCRGYAVQPGSMVGNTQHEDS